MYLSIYRMCTQMQMPTHFEIFQEQAELNNQPING